MLYVLFVNYWSTEPLKRAIASLPSTSNVDYQVVIVNNSPDDREVWQFAPLTGVTVLDADENLGFGRGCNLGLTEIWQQDPTAIVWLMNPDSYLAAGVDITQIPVLLDDHPHLSIVGTAIDTPDGEVWFAGGTFDRQWGAIAEIQLVSGAHTPSCVACDWVSGCSLILNLKQFQHCPQFDPTFFLYYEDFDLCQRYRQQGHCVAVTDRVRLVHHPSTVTNRYPYRKFVHSTFSYLVVLHRYAAPWALWWRLGRVFAHALVRLPLQPQVAFGKLNGVYRYLTLSLHRLSP